MRLLSALIVLVLLLDFRLLACPQDSAIKFFSYNIHRSSWMDFAKFWTFRKTSVLRIIQENPADIYVFQEADAEEQKALADILQGFTAVQKSRSLVLFYRTQDWKLVQSSRWRDSDSMEAGRVVLQSRSRSGIPLLDLWNIWLDEYKLEGENGPYWALSKILEDSRAQPGFVSLSLRADDAMQHSTKLLSHLLQKFQLQQAAPDIFRITSNGWWAEKKLTADWHDAVLAHKDWQLLNAASIKTKYDGSFPSTHYPLVTEYCLKSSETELFARQAAQ